jgi:hypothetical protein
LSADKYIIGSCTISSGAVVKDHAVLFENKTANAEGFLLSVYQYFKLNYPRFYKMDSLSKLGWLASEILFKDSFNSDTYQPHQMGVVLANANSSLDDDIKYYESVKDIASPSLFVYTLPNIMIGEICIRNNFKGEHALFIQPEFDAGFMDKQVGYLLDKNILEACCCGWVDFLGPEYKAVLLLVEKKQSDTSLLFSEDNMNNIFNNHPGI